MADGTNNPGKQRLALYESDWQARHIRMSAHVAKALRPTTKVRSLPLRLGDSVKVMRGDYKGKAAEIAEVDYTHNRVFLKGITRKKVDGKEAFISFRPSNLLITQLEGKDKRRLGRGKGTASTNASTEKTTKATLKPAPAPKAAVKKEGM